VYLGNFEIYREYEGDGETASLERETLHIVDGKQRVASVETRNRGEDAGCRQLVRYQFDNHLGSTCLELDERAQVISYEEYTPYGRSSYRAASGQLQAPKRYRYTGKERDCENALYYNGARYYAPWLGRWTSCDSSGMRDGPNLYAYVNDDPVNKVDQTGNWEVKWTQVAIGFGVAVVVVGAVALTAGLAAGPIAGGLATLGVSEGAIATLGTTVVAAGTAAGVVGTGNTITELTTGKDTLTGRPLTDDEASRRLGALPVDLVATALGVRALGGVRRPWTIRGGCRH